MKKKANNTCSDNMFGETRDNRVVGREYKLTDDVPKNSQLVQFYGNDWFHARGIDRVDIGTTKFPAPQRKKRGSNKVVGGGKGKGKRKGGGNNHQNNTAPLYLFGLV